MRVLIVDDSALMRSILKDFFERHGVAIAGEASNGQVAVESARRIRPDFITMDIDMPLMNGIEATETIVKEIATPIIVFSAVAEEHSFAAFAAFAAGAAEVLEKPDLEKFNDETYTTQLLETIRAVVEARERVESPRAAARGAPGRYPVRGQVRAIVLGASTGGPMAVKSVLKGLSPRFPVGIALVQHIEARFAEGYAAWLDGECSVQVRIARDGDAFTPGTALVAPGDRHLVVDGDRLRLDDGAPVRNHRPAVDRLFSSAANAFGMGLLGVLLTGMGEDGAAGCVQILGKSGFTIVQDQATSFIYGMPRAAAEQGGASVIKPLDQIAPLLQEIAGSG